MHALSEREIARIDKLCAALPTALRVMTADEEAFIAEDDLFSEWLDGRLSQWWKTKPGIEDAYPRYAEWKAAKRLAAASRSAAAKTFNDIGRAADPDEFVGELIDEFEGPDDDDH